MADTNQETLWNRTEEKNGWRDKERNYVRECLKDIKQPLTLEGLEEFFKRYNSPTNTEETAQYTAELLAELKREFTSEDLQKRTPANNALGFITEMDKINGEVSSYKWSELRGWDAQDFQGDEKWRGDILGKFNKSVENQEKEQQQAKENVEAKTGYSAEALAEVGKEVLKAKDGIEKQDVAQAAAGVKQTSSNAVKDMLSKMTDSQVAEDIVKAGLGSEHLSTGAAGLEVGAKAMQDTLEASETSQRTMYEMIKEAADMTNYPQLKEQHQGKSVDSAAPTPQIPDRDFKVEKSKSQSLSPDILKHAAKADGR